MAINDTVVLGVAGIVAATGLPAEVFSISPVLAHLFAGLYGATTSTYLRFATDKTKRPWSEWLMSIFIGVGAGIYFGPTIHTAIGFEHSAIYLVIVVTAFISQKIMELALYLIDAVMKLPWPAMLEKFLAGIGEALVKRFGGGK